MASGNSSSILPLVAIGAGLYFLLTKTSITLPGLAPAPAGDAAPPAPAPPSPSPTAPVVTAPAPNPPPTAGVTQPTPATAPLPANERERIARLAAVGNFAAVAQAESLGIRYNSDEWNYLRGAGGGGDTTTDLFPAGNRLYLMGASEYLSRRSAAGLGGINRGWRR